MSILENSIEAYLCKCININNGLCVKFVSPGWRGAPDRIVLMPMGRVYFVEVKAPGEKARKQQIIKKRILEKIGFQVWVLDTKHAVDEFIRHIVW